MNIKCCRDCKPPERHPGCGDVCRLYQIEKCVLNRANAERYKALDIGQYIVENIQNSRAMRR
jgi:hypothetical protein